MDKNKVKIIIGCIVLVIAIILRLVLYSDNSNENNDSFVETKYFFIDNYVAFSYKNMGQKNLHSQNICFRCKPGFWGYCVSAAYSAA